MRTTLALLVGMMLLSCGGGGSEAPAQTITLPPVPELTGRGLFPLEVWADASLLIGDTELNRRYRGYCGIDLTGLPPGARIESAQMRLDSAGTNGFPWDLGDMVVDHMDLGSILDPDDFNAPAIASAFTVVPRFEVGEMTHVGVAGQIQRDLNEGRLVSGFRFRFVPDSDDDGSNDFLVLAGSDSLIGAYPIVVVTFRR